MGRLFKTGMQKYRELPQYINSSHGYKFIVNLQFKQGSEYKEKKVCKNPFKVIFCFLHLHKIILHNVLVIILNKIMSKIKNQCEINDLNQTYFNFLKSHNSALQRNDQRQTALKALAMSPLKKTQQSLFSHHLRQYCFVLGPAAGGEMTSEIRRLVCYFTPWASTVCIYFRTIEMKSGQALFHFHPQGCSLSVECN